MTDEFDETLCGCCANFIELDEYGIQDCVGYEHVFDKWFRPRKIKCQHYTPDPNYDASEASRKTEATT